MFVDIRISRAVRAAGFSGSAFEKLLGNRHVWMPSLGNKRILSRNGKRLQIAKPEAVNELLDLAQKVAKNKQRIIFFCGCRFPNCNGKHACHRAVVAELLLAAAKKRKMLVRVVEWPGDSRPRKQMELKEEQFQAVRKCALFIPVRRDCGPESFKGPPWGTVMTFKCGKEAIHRVVGPLIWRRQKWQIPVLHLLFDPQVTIAKYVRLAKQDVADYGLDACVFSAPSTGSRSRPKKN